MRGFVLKLTRVFRILLSLTTGNIVNLINKWPRARSERKKIELILPKQCCMRWIVWVRAYPKEHVLQSQPWQRRTDNPCWSPFNKCCKLHTLFSSSFASCLVLKNPHLLSPASGPRPLHVGGSGVPGNHRVL